MLVIGKEKINGKKKRKKKVANTMETWKVNSNMRGIFGSSLLPLPVFFPFGREFFGGSEEKTLDLHYLFSFLFIQPNTFQKNFPFYFLSKVFHLPYFTSKQTNS